MFFLLHGCPFLFYTVKGIRAEYLPLIAYKKTQCEKIIVFCKKSVMFLFKSYILLCKEVGDDDREDGDSSQLRSRLKKISQVCD